MTVNEFERLVDTYRDKVLLADWAARAADRNPDAPVNLANYAPLQHANREAASARAALVAAFGDSEKSNEG